MQNSRKSGLGLLFIAAIVVAILYFTGSFPGSGSDLPSMKKTIVVEGNYIQGNVEKKFTLILNTDFTGSITFVNDAENGNWTVVMQNSEMIKISLLTGAQYIIVLYKENLASISLPNHQLNGKWRELNPPIAN